MNLAASVAQATVAMATPLILASLGETLVQRSGVVNVGLEGIMLAGAYGATIGALGSGNAYAGCAAGALAGAALAGLFAVFAVFLGANQVVAGVVINLLAVGITGTAYRARFGSGGAFVSTAALPLVFSGQNALTFLAVGLTPACWWWLFRTRGGLRLRACGEQPDAAAAAGVAVNTTRAVVVLIGGALAGLGGAYLSVGENNTFVPLMTNGRGFIALAIVTSGRWNPTGCLVAALLFGFADELQFQGQAFNLHLPHELLLAAPYLLTLLLLAPGGKWNAAPAALGKAWRRY